MTFKEFLVCGLQDVKVLLVGSEQLDTIDLMNIGVLCIFFRKNSLCVLVFSSKASYILVILTICSFECIPFTKLLIILTGDGV